MSPPLFPHAPYGSERRPHALNAGEGTHAEWTGCDAPRILRDRRAVNHLAPASDGLTQVAPLLERLLDGQALRQVRGIAAELQMPPDASGSLVDLVA